MTQVIALLLMRRREIVSADALVEELWNQRPPRSASSTLQTYVYHARQMFQREGIAAASPGGREFILRRSPGYSILVDDDEVDAWIAESATGSATRALEEHEPATALASADAALKLWRGPALANVPAGMALNAHATHLAETRLHLMTLRVEALRQLGRHKVLIPELYSLVHAHPLNEYLYSQLIESLYRCGRRAEALKAYRQLRSILDMELGVEPAPEVQRLHLDVLNAGWG
ncbi:MAG TPA: AfsR/SARP family transcriptional regulator [Kineosporiaceae bacterium]